jgi:hypothetical protein
MFIPRLAAVWLSPEKSNPFGADTFEGCLHRNIIGEMILPPVKALGQEY